MYWYQHHSMKVYLGLVLNDYLNHPYLYQCGAVDIATPNH